MNPNIDAANKGDMAGVLDWWFEQKIQEVESRLPCRVVSVAGNIATVQPLVKVKGTDGSTVDRGTYSVPIKQGSGGGFTVRLPIKDGDFGHIVASDRDTSLVYQSAGQDSAPNTNRTHSFADGVFEPDSSTEIPAPAGHETAAVLQSVDGSQFVAVGDNYVHVEAMGNKLEILSAGIKMTVGGQTLELRAGGLFHNNVNIGLMHRHDGVTAGTDTSGIVTV